MDKTTYEILGHDLQYVVATIPPGQSIVAEAGAMLFKHSSIEMKTVLGDGSHASSGLFNSFLSAGKRAISGEKFFLCRFENTGSRPHEAAFSSPFYGSIVSLDLADMGGKVICKKGAFLCADQNTRLNLELQTNLAVGIFGAGFIMQKIIGRGQLMVHAGGTVIERTLEPRERLQVDANCLVGFEASVDYKMKMVRGVMNMVFSGEGVAICELAGPGRIYLQSTPFSRIADQILAHLPKEITDPKK